MKTDIREKPLETQDDRLSWRYQNKAYNESYKQWRRKKQDSVGFYFAENPARLTYQDGFGFIKSYPETREAKSMKKVLSLLGGVLLFRVFFDVFSMYILPYLLGLAGINISRDLFTNRIYGSDAVIITVRFVTETLSRLLPGLFLVMYCKMPFKVMLPTKVTNKPMFMVSVPVMLLVSGVCCVMSMLYELLLSAAGISAVHSLFLPQSASWAVYFVITQIVVIPFAIELCTRGIILQLTRQFGDGTALIISSLITAMLSYDITKFFFSFITSIIIGYFTIRTGSVLTAVVMRIVYRAYIYAFYFIYFKTDPEYSPALSAAFLLVTISIGLVFMIRFLYIHSDCFGMTMKTRYMSFGKKMLIIATNIPMIMWLTAVFILSMVNLSFIPAVQP